MTSLTHATTSTPITVIGGGIAGLVASIAAADAGARNVRLVDGHGLLGGTGRSSEPPWVANLGPHALYSGTQLLDWLRHNDVLPPMVNASATKVRMRWHGQRRIAPAVLRHAPKVHRRLRDAPVDESYRDWLAGFLPDDAVQALCGAAGVLTFDADPGRLSAAYVAERLRLIVFQPKQVARYVIGGWSNLIAALANGARARGVVIHTGEHIDELPTDGPVIVAVGARAAARLLDDPTLEPHGTRTALLDVGLRHGGGDPSAVVDLDRAGFATRITSVDPSMAPAGHELVQLLAGLEPGATLADGVARMESLLDDTFTDWRNREVWRRRSVVEHRSGAVDLPGHTWRDRPAVDRGDGVFVCGDQMAAPGHLAEIAWASALDAAAGAVRAATDAARAAAPRSTTSS